MLGEIGRRAADRHAAQLGEPRLDLGVGERRIDLAVELVDDLARGALGRREPAPKARLVAGQEFTYRRNVWNDLRAHRGRHRERAQLAGLDVLYGGRKAAEIELHLSGEQVGGRGPLAAIG